MKAIVLILVAACGQVDTASPDGAVDPADAPPGADAALGDAPVLGAWSAPVRIDAVSLPGFNESYAALRTDGCELYFASNRDGGSTDIYVSGRLTTAEAWGTPAKVAELDVASSTESGPELSDDGKTIWFARALVGGTTGYDLYTATRANPSSAWETVTKVAELSTNGHERAPHVSVDGKTMWFARHDGTDYDIWVATRGSPTAAWSNLREVTRLSSAALDDDPTTVGGEDVMYFDSDRDGAVTMYTTTRQETGGWSIPVEVPELAGYLRADVTPDGRLMVLSRIAADGTTDLYESRR